MPPILQSRPKPALVLDDVTVSYEDVLRRAWAWSLLLGEAEERVCVLSENRLEWVYAAYGIWAARKALVPLDHLSTAEEVAYVLDDCEPSAVFSARCPLAAGCPACSGESRWTYLDPVWPRVGESVATLNRRVRDMIEAQLAGGRAQESLDHLPARRA